ncbi:unnamed protein product, partial [Symbiodinium sp. KB8]
VLLLDDQSADPLPTRIPRCLHHGLRPHPAWIPEGLRHRGLAELFKRDQPVQFFPDLLHGVHSPAKVHRHASGRGNAGADR